jgi:uncharacterized small protein (DUF1192 family)
MLIKLSAEVLLQVLVSKDAEIIALKDEIARLKAHLDGNKNTENNQSIVAGKHSAED